MGSAQQLDAKGERSLDDAECPMCNGGAILFSVRLRSGVVALAHCRLCNGTDYSNEYRSGHA